MQSNPVAVLTSVLPSTQIFSARGYGLFSFVCKYHSSCQTFIQYVTLSTYLYIVQWHAHFPLYNNCTSEENIYKAIKLRKIRTTCRYQIRCKYEIWCRLSRTLAECLHSTFRYSYSLKRFWGKKKSPCGVFMQPADVISWQFHSDHRYHASE